MIRSLLKPNKETIIFLIFILAYFGVRCFYLDTVPRWDAGSYWGVLSDAVSATQNAKSPQELYKVVLNKYNAFGHPSMGFYGILALFQLIDFPNQTLLNLTNILLSVFSIYCFFKILKWFFPSKSSSSEVFLATICFAFNPLAFGGSIFLNTDFPVLVFFTASFASILYGRYGLFAIASLFMIFSKETGALYWASILLGMGIYGIINTIKDSYHNSRFRFSSLFPDNHQDFPTPIPIKNILYRVICVLIPGLILLAYFFAMRGSMWQMDGGMSFNSKGWNTFGFNTRVMLYRAGEMFVLNFHWILSGLIPIFLLIGLGRRIELSPPAVLDSKRIWAIFPLLTSFVVFIAFNLSYITFIIPRYAISACFFLIILIMLAMTYCIYSPAKRQYVLALITLLSFGQTFRTIDPISHVAFDTTSFSEHKILQIDNPREAISNAFAYNAEYTMVDKLLNRMQQSIPLTPQTTLIAWHQDAWVPWFDFGLIWVDANSLERTIDWRNGFKYNLIAMHELQDAHKPLTAYYFYMPWMSVFSNEQSELSQVSNFYNVGQKQEIDIHGYKLRYYKLDLKAQFHTPKPQLVRLGSSVKIFHKSSGKCLSPSNIHSGSGTALILTSSCSTDESLFIFEADGVLKHKSSSLCVQPRSELAANGGRLILRPQCSKSTKLLTEVTDKGSIKNIQTGLCVHPQGGSPNPSDGTPVVFWNGCDEDRLQFVFKELIDIP